MAKSRKSPKKFSMKVRSGHKKHTADSLAHAALVYSIKHKMSRKRANKLMNKIASSSKKTSCLPSKGSKTSSAHKKLVKRGLLIA